MTVPGYFGDKPPRFGGKFIGFGAAIALVMFWQGGADIVFASIPPADQVDLSPGARFATRPYDGGRCPKRPLKVGDWIQGPCADANLVRGPRAYGLMAPTRHSRRSRIARWTRDRDDAALLYCGMVTGCRVVAMVKDRFAVPPL